MGLKIGLYQYQAYVLCLFLVLTLQQYGCVMCLASTCRVANVRLSNNSPHHGLLLPLTPEYQCLWFKICRAFNFTAWQLPQNRPLLPSGLSSVADWAAVSVSAASETSITATTVVASTAVIIAVTNNDDHLWDGHVIDDCLHDEYNNMTIDNGSPLL